MVQNIHLMFKIKTKRTMCMYKRNIYFENFNCKYLQIKNLELDLSGSEPQN